MVLFEVALSFGLEKFLVLWGLKADLILIGLGSASF